MVGYTGSSSKAVFDTMIFAPRFAIEQVSLTSAAARSFLVAGFRRITQRPTVRRAVGRESIEQLIQEIRKSPSSRALMSELSEQYRVLARRATEHTDFKGEWQLLREADKWAARSAAARG